MRLLRIVQLVLNKPDAEPMTGINGYRSIALASVMSATCLVIRMDVDKRPNVWTESHAGGVDGIVCQQIQLVKLSFQKLWGWQEDRSTSKLHGVRGPLFQASADVKT